MGKLTALEPQAKDPARVNVYIDGKFKLGVARELVLPLQIGQELSEDEIEQLVLNEAILTARRRALLWISRRPHTSEEIRKKLRRKKVLEPAIDQVIEQLMEKELLNDLGFAQAWVENRMTFRPRGAKMLRYELRKKGVSDEFIDKALQGHDEDRAALLAAQKAHPRYGSLPREIGERRLLAYLARRGFAYRLCRKIVQSILDDASVSVEESEVETWT